MVRLKRNLGLFEAIGLSLSVIAPTMAMALNVTLAVGAAGVAAPLGFAVGTVMVVVVGLSFIFFSRRVSRTGSAYAYIGDTFGPKAGFLAGWCMLLLYTGAGSGSAALVGDFLRAALEDHGIRIGGYWLAFSVAALLLAVVFAYREMSVAARLMLVLELSSVAVIIYLGVLILVAVNAEGGLSAAPFRPDPATGWWGVGYAVVFAVLSFAGFEAATTLAEETGQPGRAIPLALVCTVGLAGLFFVFASYVQVVGFGLDNMKALAADEAPLNTLALKYGTLRMATVLDIAAAVSAVSAVLGTLSAGARMLYALSRAGLSERAAQVHPVHGTPSVAVLIIGVLMLAGLLAWAPFIGPATYYDNVGTIGVLALILAYLGVTAAAALHGVRGAGRVWLVIGGLGTLAMAWPLYNSVYPVPAFPDNLWPYVVVAWVALGAGLLAAKPGLGRDPLE
ncbi:MAG: APC family permease [Pseudomonadota bacterium]